MGRNRGSALMWVLVSVMLVSIFVFASQTIALSLGKWAISENRGDQAYLSARSTSHALGSELLGVGPLADAVNELNVGQSVEITDIAYHMGDMGSITAAITRKDGRKYAITSTATVGGENRTVTLIMDREVISDNGQTPGLSISATSDNALEGYVNILDGDLVFPNGLNLGYGGTVDIGGNLAVASSYVSTGYYIYKVGGAVVISAESAEDITLQAPGDSIVLEGTEYAVDTMPFTIAQPGSLNIQPPAWADLTNVELKSSSGNSPLEGGSYYSVGGRDPFKTHKLRQLTSENPAYLVVDGVNLNISGTMASADGLPIVHVILLNNGSVSLTGDSNSPTYYMGIYGDGNVDTAKPGTTIVGQVAVNVFKSKSDSAMPTVIQYVDCGIYTGDPGVVGAGDRIIWTMERYIDG